jgi:succinate dehydrogenase/fumarate reductase-like Fe-S protein
MKLVYEVELPDNASPSEVLDAMAYASRNEQGWKKIYSLSTRMEHTCLEGKCGSCNNFHLWWDSKVNGVCGANHPWGPRTRPACKDYVRDEE